MTLRVHNKLTTSSSIHWHGIILPFNMDGVPGISFPGIPAGETFTYQFPVRQSGTYWYHSHTRFQEQTGLYGAIVIEPAAGEPIHADRDHVVLLSDWTDENPEHIFATLKQMSEFYNFQLPTAQDFVRDAKSMGVQAARVAGPAEFEPAFRAAIESGRPTLLDIDLLALTPLSLTAPRPAAR